MAFAGGGQVRTNLLSIFAGAPDDPSRRGNLALGRTCHAAPPRGCRFDIIIRIAERESREQLPPVFCPLFFLSPLSRVFLSLL